MTPQELKNSILQLAIQGKLVEQRPEEGTGEELYKLIQAEKGTLMTNGKKVRWKVQAELTNDDLPYDIPDSWKWVRLGEIISIESGKGLTASQMRKGNIPVYGGNGITGYHNESLIHKKTVVIGRVGFYCGSVHVTEKEAWVTDNAFITTYPEKNIDREYLVYMLRHMNLGQDNNATAQPVVSGKKIYPLPFPIPPLDEQKRIVAKIEELLPLIDRYEQAWTKLEDFNKRFPVDMQKSILQMAIQGKLVPQDVSEGTGEELYRQIQAEKQKLIKAGKIKKDRRTDAMDTPQIDDVPFDIPESWKWVYLGSILNKLTDGTHKTPKYATNGVKFVSVKDMSSGVLSLENTKYITTSEHEELFKRCDPVRGDMLLSKVGTTGVPAIVDTDEPFSLFVSVALLKYSHSYIDEAFLYYLLKSPLVQMQAIENTRGVGNKNWVLDAIAKTLVVLPPLDEQKRIVAKLEELLPLCERLQ